MKRTLLKGLILMSLVAGGNARLGAVSCYEQVRTALVV